MSPYCDSAASRSRRLKHKSRQSRSEFRPRLLHRLLRLGGPHARNELEAPRWRLKFGGGGSACRSSLQPARRPYLLPNCSVPSNVPLVRPVAGSNVLRIVNEPVAPAKRPVPLVTVACSTI